MTSRNMAMKLISLFLLLSSISNASAGTVRKRKVFADAVETMERIEKEVREIAHRLNDDVQDDHMPSPDNDEEKRGNEEPPSIPEINKQAHTKDINLTHMHVYGDLLLTDRQIQIEKEDNALPEGVQLDAVSNPALIWPKNGDGTGNVYIPYLLEDSVRKSSTKKWAIGKAIEHYNAFSCIRWVPVTDKSKHHVRFFSGEGCYSLMGKVTYSQYKGYQPISIGPNCGTVGIVEHEMLHALGFFHEQSRPDRDNYVKLQLYNLEDPSPQNKYQFRKQKAAAINSVGQAYDLNSIMHYASGDFAKPGTYTMVKLDGGVIRSNRRHFSKSDLKQLNAIYRCKGYPKPPPPPKPVKRCRGINNGCCTPSSKCINGDGDCDENEDCVSGRCGKNNCEWDSYKWWQLGLRDDCCF